MKNITDGKGHLVGKETDGKIWDGKGHLVARVIPGNRTVDDKGHMVGIGDQRLRQLGKDEDAK